MNKSEIIKKAPDGAEVYALVGGVVTYFYIEDGHVYFMTGKPYLHASITKFYQLA